MTRFGIPEHDYTPAIRGLCGELDPRCVDDAFARAAWTGIAEPGDRVAGALIEAIGAADALTGLIEAWSPQRILAELRDRHPEAPEIDALSPEATRAARERWLPRLNAGAAVARLRQGQRLGVRLLRPSDELWPVGVDDLGVHAPIALWMRGTPEACAALGRSISLVGARAASGYGEHVAMEAAAGLADRGFAIVSGAAYGIDGTAHRAALASGGHTIAFLAGGPDRFYPSGHDALLTRIVETGAVITELPPGSQPSKWRFLQRNRLIAAASQATVVLEAGWRSGSLNTAGHAAALGRPLGAVPGPVTSPASAGCHRLIREFDAVCVTTPEEMAELTGDADGALLPARSLRETGASPTPTVTRILDSLSARSARAPEDIAARAGFSLAETQAGLGALELDGTVRRRGEGWVRCG